MFNVFVVSDGTGRTAIQALDAALTQFPKKHVDIYVKPGIRSKEQVQAVVHDAAEQNAIVVHTLVSDIIRSYMIRFARRNNVETIDLMWPLLMRLSNRLSNLPAEKPGLYHETHKDYFRRIEAMEYTFRHDDGLRVHEIDKADIVILGVSRTFKTPLSIYLALKGLLVSIFQLSLG
jgi:regulator of PEP synthase PpsR (kinase-PPPase family)